MSPVSPVFHTEVTVKLYAVSVFLFGNKSGCGKISRPSTNPYPWQEFNELLLQSKYKPQCLIICVFDDHGTFIQILRVIDITKFNDVDDDAKHQF